MMIEHILLELFQNRLICKKAVSKGWCKDSSIATMYLVKQNVQPKYMSRVMRKPTFCKCINKDADQRLCFRYIDSTIPLLSNSEISSL